MDHIAFLPTGWPRHERAADGVGQDVVGRTVPSLGLREVFLTDPSGVTIELNYSRRRGRGMRPIASPLKPE